MHISQNWYSWWRLSQCHQTEEVGKKCPAEGKKDSNQITVQTQHMRACTHKGSSSLGITRRNSQVVQKCATHEIMVLAVNQVTQSVGKH